MIDDQFPTMLDQAIKLLPSACAAAVAVVAWYAICRLIYRREHAQWRQSIADAPEAAPESIDQRIALSYQKLTIARRGSPADRLFGLGLALVGTLTAIYLGWFVLFVV